MDKNQGYAILKAVMLENGRGFALGEHPTAPSRYVTWACHYYYIAITDFYTIYINNSICWVEFTAG